MSSACPFKKIWLISCICICRILESFLKTVQTSLYVVNDLVFFHPHSTQCQGVRGISNVRNVETLESPRNRKEFRQMQSMLQNFSSERRNCYRFDLAGQRIRCITSKLFTSNERNALKCNAFHEKKNTSVAALARYIYVNIKSALIGPYSVKHRCHTVGMYPQTDVLFVLGIWR